MTKTPLILFFALLSLSFSVQLRNYNPKLKNQAFNKRLEEILKQNGGRSLRPPRPSPPAEEEAATNPATTPETSSAPQEESPLDKAEKKRLRDERFKKKLLRGLELARKKYFPNGEPKQSSAAEETANLLQRMIYDESGDYVDEANNEIVYEPVDYDLEYYPPVINKSELGEANSSYDDDE